MSRSTRAWRKLRDQVVQEEPLCRLQYQGICTGLSQTADHVIPYKIRPDLHLVRSNLIGACNPCNMHKGARITLGQISDNDPPALGFFG